MTAPATVPPEKVTPLLLDVRGVAALLGCSARQVFRLSDAGRLPAPVRVGRLIRWRYPSGRLPPG